MFDEGDDGGGGETGVEKNGSFAFGKALFAKTALEQSGIVRTVGVLDADISFASNAVFRTLFILAAKRVQVVHDHNPYRKSTGIQTPMQTEAKDTI